MTNPLDKLEEDWKNSHKGKLWSTAVQKCFEAPFVEVAIQHLLFRIDQNHQKMLEELAEIVEGIANGNAFDPETGLIWQHWIDEAKRISTLTPSNDKTSEEKLLS